MKSQNKKLHINWYVDLRIGWFSLNVRWHSKLKQLGLWIGRRNPEFGRHSIDGNPESKKIWKPWFEIKNNLWKTTH